MRLKGILKYDGIILLPMLNLLFMHYFFYMNRYLEWTWFYSIFINLCSIVFDVFLLLIISLVIVKGRFKPAVAITQFITLIWSFVNVMYGRFFFQYMSISAINEAHGLGDSLVVNSILSGFHWYDLFYVVSAIVFIGIYRRTPKKLLSASTIMKLSVVPVLSLLLTFVAYSAYHFIHPQYRNNWDLYVVRVKEFLYDSVRGGTPNLAHFQTGCLRVAAFEIYDMCRVVELTQEQRNEIADFYRNNSDRTSHHLPNPEIRNVIFILLESFLSAPIDLIVEGKEVTPFLNSLKNEFDVYYNGKMKSDIGCGESGDGQFIYMNGILPLSYKMTIGQVKNHTLPALPIVLREKMKLKHCEIIIPTPMNLWQQADMNIVYGLTEAYSQEDVVGNNVDEADDQSIFDFSSKLLSPAKEPFFSLILSISTHSPYDHYVGDDFLQDKGNYPEEYKYYLNTCHYTDNQLKKYFNTLKRVGIYDQSLIVVASDHHAHLDRLKMKGKISDCTPLFIIHGHINNEQIWDGEFHQLDVYTTILDVLGIDSEWKGLGRTLLSSNYSNSVNDKAHYVSELIIEGDYFSDAHDNELRKQK